MVEYLAKQSKPDIDRALDQILGGKGVKVSEFWKDLETGAQHSNELRFYHEILVPQLTTKSLQVLLNSRKQVLATKQVTNYPGLAMDRVFLGLDEWSAVVTRLFAGHNQPAQSMLKFQAALDHLCKSHNGLKSVKENISRVTLTTLLECVYQHACAAERSLDPTGKHIVEQTLVDRPATSPATNLGLLGQTRVPGAKQPRLSGAGLSSADSRPGQTIAPSPLGLAGAYVARAQSPQRLKETAPEAEQSDYSAYHKLLQRKADLAAELKSLEAEHARESSRTIAGLAEVLALSKVQKNADADFLVVSKEYLAFMRRKISASGRKSVNAQDFQRFQALAELQSKMTSAKKEQEITLKLSEELGENFRKFMRNNFSVLKKAEQEFLKKMFEAKERANLKAKVQTNLPLEIDEADEGVEEEASLESRLNHGSQQNSTSQDRTRPRIVSVEESEDLEVHLDGPLEPVEYPHGNDTWTSMDHMPEKVEAEEQEIAEAAKQDHRFSDIPHQDVLLDSEIQEDTRPKRKTVFGQVDNEEMIGENDAGWGSAGNFVRHEDTESVVYDVKREKFFDSAACEDEDVGDLPTSSLFNQEPRKRMATEPQLQRVLAESLVEEDGPRSATQHFGKGMSASDVFANDRESIVKRLPIPKLDTGSQVEIMMTDEAEPGPGLGEPLPESS